MSDPTRILEPGDDSQPDLRDAGDGWELQDVGRVRGTGLAGEVRTPAGGAESDGDDARGDDPYQLTNGLKPAEQPETITKDHTDVTDDGDGPSTAADAEAEMAAGGKPKADATPAEKPDPEKPGKRTLPGRVETLRQEVGRLSAERRAEVAAVAKLRAERLALETKPAAAAAAPVRDAAGKFAPKPEVVADEGPQVPDKPVWKTYEDADKSFEEFTADQDAYFEARLARNQWETKADIAASKADAQKAITEREAREAQGRHESAFEHRMDVVRKEADFDAVVQAWDDIPAIPFLADVVRMHPNGPKVYLQLGREIDRASVLASYDWTMPAFDAVMATNDPTALLLHLADHPDEFKRIVQLPERHALVELGRIDARLSSSATAGERDNGPRPVPVSKAPKPIRPVGGARTTAATPASPYEMEFGPEYVKQVNEQARTR